MDAWQRFSLGIDCPLCLPQRSVAASLYPIRQLDSCTLYLVRDQRYHGACRAIYDPRHVNRIDELSLAQWQTLARDLWRAQRALVGAVHCAHVNLASLGNEVPHLHWHLIPRARDDGLWGAPVWQADSRTGAGTARLLSEQEYASLASRIGVELDRDAP